MTNKANLGNIAIGLAGATILSIAYRMLGHETSFGSCFIAFLIAYPWKIGKNIYSIFGGFNPEGSVFSLAAIVSVAEKHSFTLTGVTLYQKAGGNAVAFLGIIILQKSTLRNAILGAGFIFCQDANQKAIIITGIIITQNSRSEGIGGLSIIFIQENGESTLFAGIVMLQYSDYGDSRVVFGVSLAQMTHLFSAGDAELYMGFVIFQGAGGECFLGIGITGVQIGRESNIKLGICAAQLAGDQADLTCGIVFYQKAKKAGTYFGIPGYRTVVKPVEEKSGPVVVEES